MQLDNLIGPDIRSSPFVHILRILLVGGMIVYGWQAISAFTRRPTSKLLAVRKAVNAAWLGVLYLLITRLNPLPYLQAAGFLAVVLIVFSVWDRLEAKREEEPQKV